MFKVTSSLVVLEKISRISFFNLASSILHAIQLGLSITMPNIYILSLKFKSVLTVAVVESCAIYSACLAASWS